MIPVGFCTEGIPHFMADFAQQACPQQHSISDNQPSEELAFCQSLRLPNKPAEVKLYRAEELSTVSRGGVILSGSRQLPRHSILCVPLEAHLLHLKPKCNELLQVLHGEASRYIQVFDPRMDKYGVT